MRNYLLDFGGIESKKDAYQYIGERLSFPDYYGRNADALHDCLTDMRQSRFIIRNGSKLEEIGAGVILTVFRDVAKARKWKYKLIELDDGQ